MDGAQKLTVGVLSEPDGTHWVTLRWIPSNREYARHGPYHSLDQADLETIPLLRAALRQLRGDHEAPL